jgi:predicted secreted protein
MAIEKELKIGEIVDVDLTASLGSTGYGWELASLEGKTVCLVTMSVIQIDPRPGAPEIQRFTFKAVAEGRGNALFVLTAAWKNEAPKETVECIFNVAKPEATDAATDLRLKGFTASPKLTVRRAGQPTEPPAVRFYYGVLPPQAIYSAPLDPCLCTNGTEDCCTQPQPKYGVPQPLYAAPVPTTGPCVCADGCEDHCSEPPVVLRYNFPMMRYNFPPVVMRYNFPTKTGR